MNRINRQQGMTLLEVVVSMLFIGLGMVASISMIQESMRSNISALNRNSALYLSDAIIDRMRVNSFAIPQYLSGNANSLVGIEMDNNKPIGVALQSCPDCTDSQKNAYKQAKKDVDEWISELSEKLPDAQYAIYAENADLGQYAVKLSWPNRLDRGRLQQSSGDTSLDQNDDMVIAFTL